MSTSNAHAAKPSGGSRKSGSYAALIFVFLLVAAAGGYYLYVARTEGNVQAADALGSLKPLVMEQAKYRTLDPRYTDANGDLIADAPTDASKLQDPKELRFVGIAADYADNPEAEKKYWKDLLDHIAKVTDKKAVVFAEDVKTFDDQLRGLRDDRLHITAFSTGQVPGAVNTAGFVPLVCPANAEGKYSYEMEIFVRPDSAIQSPKDLKGKTIAFSAMSSNSGSRAPMVILSNEFQLLPGRDYNFVFTGDQLKSMQALKAAKFDAICVANDFFKRQIDDPKNTMKAEEFKSIYKSKTFPPLCFGVSHDLKPELRGKIEEALTSFQIPGSSVKRPEARFAPVNYKLDWTFVREVDDALSRLPDAK